MQKDNTIKPMSKRPSGRLNTEMRAIRIETDINLYAEGSCLVQFGNTKVHCTASIDENVPRWLKGEKQGWVTAEYGMLPRSTHDRMEREAVKGKQSGRTQEISRLIGRALRTVVDLSALGERTICVDCDVLQADGGTRTAAITGAFVSLHLAAQRLLAQGKIERLPIEDFVAAVSCGITANGAVIDLDYKEDSNALADGNYVMTGKGGIIEIQLTGEQRPLTEEETSHLLSLARHGIETLITLQKEAINRAAHHERTPA